MNTPSTTPLQADERPKDRVESWSHPITGVVSLVRVTRDAQGFGIIRQQGSTSADRPEFEDCQFGAL